MRQELRHIALAKLSDGPQPEHAHRAGLAIHARGDFFERQTLQVAEDNHLAISGPQPGELSGDFGGPFTSIGRFAGRVAAIGQALAETARTAIEPRPYIVERNFATQIAAAGFDVCFVGMVQAVDQNLPEPGEQFAFAAAAKLLEVAIRSKQRILHQITWAESPPQTSIELSVCQHQQIVVIPLQQLTQCGSARLPRRCEQPLSIGRIGRCVRQRSDGSQALIPQSMQHLAPVARSCILASDAILASKLRVAVLFRRETDR